MLRYTIQDMLGLTVVGAISCVLAFPVAADNPVAEMIAAALLFVFGGACYMAGNLIGRGYRISD